MKNDEVLFKVSVQLDDKGDSHEHWPIDRWHVVAEVQKYLENGKPLKKGQTITITRMT